MGIRGWRAYHADGRTWDSTEVDWTDLPDGVVGVVEFRDPPYRKLLNGGDWMWMEDGRWQESESVWGGWMEKPHPEAIRGQALSDERWQEIRAAMRADREWPDGD